MTMPGDHFELGTRHPISITREEIISIFRKQGYALAEGPEIEDDHHVFEALNFPPDHPARDMQDTFFISSGVNPVLLRTSAPAGCSATKLSQPVHTASSTRLKASMWTRTCLLPTSSRRF